MQALQRRVVAAVVRRLFGDVLDDYVVSSASTNHVSLSDLRVNADEVNARLPAHVPVRVLSASVSRVDVDFRGATTRVIIDSVNVACAVVGAAPARAQQREVASSERPARDATVDVGVGAVAQLLSGLSSTGTVDVACIHIALTPMTPALRAEWVLSLSGVHVRLTAHTDAVATLASASAVELRVHELKLGFRLLCGAASSHHSSQRAASAPTRSAHTHAVGSGGTDDVHWVLMVHAAEPTMPFLAASPHTSVRAVGGHAAGPSVSLWQSVLYASKALSRAPPPAEPAGGDAHGRRAAVFFRVLLDPDASVGVLNADVTLPRSHPRTADACTSCAQPSPSAEQPASVRPPRVSCCVGYVQLDVTTEMPSLVQETIAAYADIVSTAWPSSMHAMSHALAQSMHRPSPPVLATASPPAKETTSWSRMLRLTRAATGALWRGDASTPSLLARSSRMFRSMRTAASRHVMQQSVVMPKDASESVSSIDMFATARPETFVAEEASILFSSALPGPVDDAAPSRVNDFLTDLGIDRIDDAGFHANVASVPAPALAAASPSPSEPVQRLDADAPVTWAVHIATISCTYTMVPVSPLPTGRGDRKLQLIMHRASASSELVDSEKVASGIKADVLSIQVLWWGATADSAGVLPLPVCTVAAVSAEMASSGVFVAVEDGEICIDPRDVADMYHTLSMPNQPQAPPPHRKEEHSHEGSTVKCFRFSGDRIVVRLVSGDERNTLLAADLRAVHVCRTPFRAGVEQHLNVVHGVECAVALQHRATDSILTFRCERLHASTQSSQKVLLLQPAAQSDATLPPLDDARTDTCAYLGTLSVHGSVSAMLDIRRATDEGSTLIEGMLARVEHPEATVETVQPSLRLLVHFIHLHVMNAFEGDQEPSVTASFRQIVLLTRPDGISLTLRDAVASIRRSHERIELGSINKDTLTPAAFTLRFAGGEGGAKQVDIKDMAVVTYSAAWKCGYDLFMDTQHELLRSGLMADAHAERAGATADAPTFQLHVDVSACSVGVHVRSTTEGGSHHVALLAISHASTAIAASTVQSILVDASMSLLDVTDGRDRVRCRAAADVAANLTNGVDAISKCIDFEIPVSAVADLMRVGSNMQRDCSFLQQPSPAATPIRTHVADMTWLQSVTWLDSPVFALELSATEEAPTVVYEQPAAVETVSLRDAQPPSTYTTARQDQPDAWSPSTPPMRQTYPAADVVHAPVQLVRSRACWSCGTMSLRSELADDAMSPCLTLSFSTPSVELDWYEAPSRSLMPYHHGFAQKATLRVSVRDVELTVVRDPSKLAPLQPCLVIALRPLESGQPAAHLNISIAQRSAVAPTVLGATASGCDDEVDIDAGFGTLSIDADGDILDVLDIVLQCVSALVLSPSDAVALHTESAPPYWIRQVSVHPAELLVNFQPGTRQLRLAYGTDAPANDASSSGALLQQVAGRLGVSGISAVIALVPVSDLRVRSPSFIVRAPGTLDAALDGIAEQMVAFLWTNALPDLAASIPHQAVTMLREFIGTSRMSSFLIYESGATAAARPLGTLGRAAARIFASMSAASSLGADASDTSSLAPGRDVAAAVGDAVDGLLARPAASASTYTGSLMHAIAQAKSLLTSPSRHLLESVAGPLLAGMLLLVDRALSVFRRARSSVPAAAEPADSSTSVADDDWVMLHEPSV